MIRAFVFPGQGSQAVGMGQDLSEAFAPARQVFEEVDDALGQKLSKLMAEGPIEELTLTENAQPALMAVSMAVMAVLREEGGMEIDKAAACVAGHSLGEYSALAAAGTFSLSDTARLLRTRGQAMQKAVPVGEGAMAAIIGLDLDVARAVADEAAEGDVCTAANDNAPGQVVLSGAKVAIDRAVILAKEKGAKMAVLLPVSAPFHCSLMLPAADVMLDALSNVNMYDPIVPLIANVTAEATTSSPEIRRLLVEQVTGAVRWRECVLAMKELEVEHIIEIGTGKVLTGLTRRIDRELSGTAVNSTESLEAFMGTL